MAPTEAALIGGVRSLFHRFEEAHRAEDVDSYLAFFVPDAVWVTSRGMRIDGREALGDYLRRVIPGGLAGGTVNYAVELVRQISSDSVVVVVEQTYFDQRAQPRSPDARHTHTYVLTAAGEDWQIAAGQNTVRL